MSRSAPLASVCLAVTLRACLALGILTLAACATDDSEEPADACATEDACAAASALGAESVPFTTSRIQAARYPIILHHGFNASSTNSWSFYRVKEALERDGHTAVVTEVEPFAGVPTRARRLAGLVDAAIADACAARSMSTATCATTMKVNLIAHSMGGLDARYLAATLGYAPKIASITTISTPHRGSGVADVGLGILPDQGRFADVVNHLAGCFGRTFTREELTTNTDVHAALESLSTANAPAFSAANPDQPGVSYQSWAGVSRAIGGPRTAAGRAEVLAACDGLYRGDPGRADFMAASLVAGSFAVGDGPQDGMVTVPSAKWGTFRGCFPADHLDEVGQAHKTGPNTYTGFDHLAFYRTVASELAARGF
jgi:triacylglycerol lipase